MPDNTTPTGEIPGLMGTYVPAIPEYMKGARIILGGKVARMACKDGDHWWLFYANDHYKCWTSERRLTADEVRLLTKG